MTIARLTASLVLALGAPALAAIGAQTGTVADAEARAVAYLTVEVPRWHREHGCYSCHNNGDAARALLAARERGHSVDAALADTNAWLAAPARWDSNVRRGGSEELPLARIQFASALASLVAAGTAPAAALDAAVPLLLAHQQTDGSWQPNQTQPIGGATSYGAPLATAMARRTLANARHADASSALAKADAWLRALRAVTVHDAAAVVYGLGASADAAANTQRAAALDLIKRGQGPDGGWGPYVTSRSEPFDTALVVLALVEARTAIGPSMSIDLTEPLNRARTYLIDTQLPDGSWQETTRPADDESYAQRISTSAWALLALLGSE